MEISDIQDYFGNNAEPCFQSISDPTSQDLNIDEVFEDIDCTYSSVGKQYLYNLLRSMPDVSPIKEYEPWLLDYNKDELAQKKIEKFLSKLKHPDAYSIWSLLYQEHEILPLWIILIFHILRFLPFLCLLVFFATLNQIALWFFMPALLVNLGIHFKYKSKAFAYSWSIPQLYKLIDNHEKLSKLSIIQDLNLNSKDSIGRVKKIKSLSSSFRYNVKLEMSILTFVWLFVEFIRIFFLFEPISLNKIFVEIRKNKLDLINVFKAFGLVDTLQSVNQVRKKRTNWCQPIFTDKKEIEAKDMTHPLIDNCVANSFTISDKSILILGSNMSGKTSFIRTLGVNVVLAQTINTCFAEEFCLHKQKIYTGITTKDNLIEGKSYYLSEVLHLRNIVEETQVDNNLILLDELFKGTNTIERIAGASSVLKFLAKNENNTILIATHDNELIDICQSNYIPYFFSEKVIDNELVFDYKIEHTLGYNRNAIKILDIYHYPREIIKDAMEVVDSLKK